MRARPLDVTGAKQRLVSNGPIDEDATGDRWVPSFVPHVRAFGSADRGDESCNKLSFPLSLGSTNDGD